MGLKTRSDKRWYRKLVFFYKIVNKLSPLFPTPYLNNNTHPLAHNTTMSSQNTSKSVASRTGSFENSFYSYFVKVCHKLDLTLNKAESLRKFKTLIKQFIKSGRSLYFCDYAPVGVKLWTRIYVDFSHLNEHKFRVIPMCDCGSEIEITRPILLSFPFLSVERNQLLKSFHNIKLSITKLETYRSLYLLI